MRLFIVFILVGAFVSCDSPKKEQQKKEVFEMHEPSEMAVYMNDMYGFHERLKENILSGETPTEFSEEILKIHSAELTDDKGRNETFEKFSHLFVEQVEIIFDESSNVPLKQRYNNAVNLCISCHTSECPGPIPRIKKLLIK